jgi:hypothetical protein
MPRTRRALRGRGPKWPKLETRLREWIIERREAGFSYPQATFCCKAQSFLGNLKLTNKGLYALGVRSCGAMVWVSLHLLQSDRQFLRAGRLKLNSFGSFFLPPCRVFSHAMLETLKKYLFHSTCHHRGLFMLEVQGSRCENNGAWKVKLHSNTMLPLSAQSCLLSSYTKDRQYQERSSQQG